MPLFSVEMGSENLLIWLTGEAARIWSQFCLTEKFVPCLPQWFSAPLRGERWWSCLMYFQFSGGKQIILFLLTCLKLAAGAGSVSWLSLPGLSVNEVSAYTCWNGWTWEQCWLPLISGCKHHMGRSCIICSGNHRAFCVPYIFMVCFMIIIISVRLKMNTPNTGRSNHILVCKRWNEVSERLGFSLGSRGAGQKLCILSLRPGAPLMHSTQALRLHKASLIGLGGLEIS